MWDGNPELCYSPNSLRLPLQKEQIAATKAIVADNKGAQWTVAQAIGLQISGNIELKYDLARFLLELEGVPTSTISDMTGISGLELREIATSDPISLFPCLDCGEVVLAPDRRDQVGLRLEYRDILRSRQGDMVVANSLCQLCTEARLQLYAEERRVSNLAQQARGAQLRRMPFDEYRLTLEWQVKRTQALSRAGYRCQVCGEHDARLDVHHNTYERYGNESIYDLVVLCERCHELFHGGLQDAS